MTGLEKILSKIEYDSNDQCQRIISQANTKAEKLIGDAEAKAKEITQTGKAETAKELENIRQSAVSSSELAKSRIILSAKLKTIDDVLDKALENIKSMPRDEYFSYLCELIVKNAKEGEGVLRLPEDDMKSLDKSFIDGVNKKLEASKSVKLGDAADIDSGFLLVYGDIDINCSFDAIASEKRDELRDELNSLLFA
ncbi:MAG: V-type ATP synthase subunit E [Eubacterium sp.]|nr:V-type ATP synthase subunit E [Eubacterium sp.]